MQRIIAIVYTLLSLTFLVEAIVIDAYLAIPAVLWMAAATLAWINYDNERNPR